eukprot:6200817-Pleurochrysis_carterae.AAC.2
MQPSSPPPDHCCGTSVSCTWCTCAPSPTRTTTTSMGLPTEPFTIGTIDSVTPLYSRCCVARRTAYSADAAHQTT